MENGIKCGKLNCGRLACVAGVSEESNFDPTTVQGMCLVHFYGNPNMLGKKGMVIRAREKEFRKQQQDLRFTMTNLLDEIEDDFGNEIARQASRLKRKSSSGTAMTLITGASSSPGVNANESSVRKKAKKTSSSLTDSTPSAVRSVDIEKLYEWQLKARQKVLHKNTESFLETKDKKKKKKKDKKEKKKKDKGKKKSKDEVIDISDNEDGGKSVVVVDSDKETKPKVKRWVLSGDELLGQKTVPNEVWRRQAAAYLANALFQDQGRATIMCGERALELENTLYEMTMGANPQLAPVSSQADTTFPAEAEERQLLERRESVSEETPEQKVKKQRALYSSHMRQILYNLRDEGNESVRTNLLNGALSIQDAILNPNILVAAEKAKKIHEEQQMLIEKRRVVDTEEALSFKRVVDNLKCPKCGNMEKNFLLTLGAHQESSKCEIWGNKESREIENVRQKCSKCNFTWMD